MTVVDRGPLICGRVIDVSASAADELGFRGRGREGEAGKAERAERSHLALLINNSSLGRSRRNGSSSLVKSIVHWKERNGITTSSLEWRRRSRLRSILFFQETRNLSATSRRGSWSGTGHARKARIWSRPRRPGRRDTAASSRIPSARLCAGTRASDRGFLPRRPLKGVCCRRPPDRLPPKHFDEGAERFASFANNATFDFESSL